ncbi:MAG: hypothetical protein ACJ79T_22845, partial [Myxococcales bacterium]
MLSPVRSSVASSGEKDPGEDKARAAATHVATSSYANLTAGYAPVLDGSVVSPSRAGSLSGLDASPTEVDVPIDDADADGLTIARPEDRV